MMTDPSIVKNPDIPSRALSDRERSHFLFQDAPIGICFVTSSGRYLGVNPALARMYGFDSPEEMLEMRPEATCSFVDIEDRARLLGLLGHLDVVTGFESLMKCKDGSEVWTSRTLRRIRAEGCEECYVSFIEDIQARKETELAARSARQQLIEILGQLEAGLFVMDSSTKRILFANTYLTNALGKELVGEVANETLPMIPGACAFTRGEEGFGQTGDTLTREILFANDRWYLCTAKLTEWFTPEPAVIVVASDITEQREAQAAKEDIDRIVRHDLKSPLTGIIGLPEMMLSTGEYSDEDREHLGLIRDSGRKMLRLIDSSLSMYKIELGTYELLLGPIDMAVCLKQVVEELADPASTKLVRVETNVLVRPPDGGNILAIQADTTLIPFMFSNLLKNAIEAAPRQGAVTITLRSLDPLLVDIHNPGAVPEPMRDRFFEKYATYGKKNGTGLGTYSAQLVAKAHGGRVTMRTSEQEGTTVSVALDRQPPGQAMTAAGRG